MKEPKTNGFYIAKLSQLISISLRVSFYVRNLVVLLAYRGYLAQK